MFDIDCCSEYKNIYLFQIHFYTFGILRLLRMNLKATPIVGEIDLLAFA